MDHAGQPGLAGAGLASEHDGRVLGGDPANLLDKLPHPSRGHGQERFVAVDRRNLGKCDRLRGRRCRRRLGPGNTVSGREGEHVDQVAQPPQVERAAEVFGDPQTK